MKVTRKSIITQQEHTLDLPVTPEQLAAYEAGALLQDVFRHLSPAAREFIKTGVTAKEWQDEVVGRTDGEEVWYIDEQWQVREAGTDIIIASIVDTRAFLGEELPRIHAAMIAAAPRLMAACRKALAYLTDRAIDPEGEDEEILADDLRHELEDAVSPVLIR